MRSATVVSSLFLCKCEAINYFKVVYLVPGVRYWNNYFYVLDWINLDHQILFKI